MNTLILVQVQNVNIEDKLNSAPNSDYAMGVLIGSFIPVIVLALIAYGIYYYNKNKK